MAKKSEFDEKREKIKEDLIYLRNGLDELKMSMMKDIDMTDTQRIVQKKENKLKTKKFSKKIQKQKINLLPAGEGEFSKKIQKQKINLLPAGEREFSKKIQKQKKILLPF